MVQDYIHLEQARYGNNLDLHIELPENTNNLHIAPLLLLPLVENCFKHGASSMLEQPWINLQVTIQRRQMQVKLINGKARRHSEDRSGIGINNVRQRLALLYPEKHEMIITDDEDVFIVNLKIELEVRMEAKPTITKEELSHA